MKQFTVTVRRDNGSKEEFTVVADSEMSAKANVQNMVSRQPKGGKALSVKEV